MYVHILMSRFTDVIGNQFNAETAKLCRTLNESIKQEAIKAWNSRESGADTARFTFEIPNDKFPNCRYFKYLTIYQQDNYLVVH